MSSPNMKEIHDSHLSFWSPQPYFIGGFFFPQQIVQVAWLYRLWKLNPKKSEAEKKELDQIVDFVPYYAIGNFCIGSKLSFPWIGVRSSLLTLFSKLGSSSGTRPISRARTCLSSSTHSLSYSTSQHSSSP